MQLERYAFVKDPEKHYYEFYSEGPLGRVRKLVEYYRLPDVKTVVYNLSFGDWEEDSGKLNDKAVTNNADRDKVLATVAATVLDFMNNHPGASVFVAGNTPARTRLHQMGINRLWDEINNTFHLYGFVKGDWRPFKKGINYSSFLLQKR